MPIFARQFSVPRGKKVADARLYLSGVGLHHATVNGREMTDEVLAPGNSNYQLSSEYRTYDVTGDAARAAPTRSASSSATAPPTSGAASPTRPSGGPRRTRGGRASSRATAPWPPTPRPARTTVELDNVTGYHVGGTDQRRHRRRRRPARVPHHHRDRHPARTAPASPSRRRCRRARRRRQGHRLGQQHRRQRRLAPARPSRRGSSAGSRSRYRDGSRATIVPTAPGGPRSARWSPTPGTPAPTTTPAANSPAGTARAPTSAPTAKRRDGTTTGWIAAGIAPPPNLATRLVARAAEPVTVAGEVQAGLRHQPGARHLGVRLRAEHRRLAPARPATACRPARPSKSPRPSRSTPTARSTRPRSWAAAVRGVDLFNTYTAAGDRRRDVAPGLQLLRHAVGPGHRPARRLRADAET